MTAKNDRLRGKNREREREGARRAAVSFYFPKHNTHLDTYSPSGLQQRPMNHLRFWLGPPGELAGAPILRLRNLGPRTALGIKAIYKLSPLLRPPRRCLAPDPLPFIGFVLIAE